MLLLVFLFLLANMSLNTNIYRTTKVPYQWLFLTIKKNNSIVNIKASYFIKSKAGRKIVIFLSFSCLAVSPKRFASMEVNYLQSNKEMWLEDTQTHSHRRKAVRLQPLLWSISRSKQAPRNMFHPFFIGLKCTIFGLNRVLRAYF